MLSHEYTCSKLQQYLPMVEVCSHGGLEEKLSGPGIPTNQSPRRLVIKTPR